MGFWEDFSDGFAEGRKLKEEELAKDKAPLAEKLGKGALDGATRSLLDPFGWLTSIFKSH